MRKLTAAEIAKIELLTEYSVELVLLEPTETGLAKSIMDATGIVRNYLKEHNLHNYDLQKQGPENKVEIRAYLIEESRFIPSKASLYRPITKNGDPRIWFKDLASYSKANEILGLIAFRGIIYVLNVSRIDVENLLILNISNPLQDIAKEIKAKSNKTAEELLSLLRKIAVNGPVPALINADTAVGRTLEHLLGIDINSSKKPDYKGIELKSFRENKGNRKTLFAQVPNWNLSKFKSSGEILRNFGYKRGSDFKLYCTVSTTVYNSQGLRLKVDENLNHLLEFSEKVNVGTFVSWPLYTLHERLLEKHSETFWISAESLKNDGKEFFQYKTVEHTRKPIVTQFDILLSQGIITLDHLIKRTTDGKIVEKGPLFKIKPNATSLLFPPGKIYNLTH